MIVSIVVLVRDRLQVMMSVYESTGVLYNSSTYTKYSLWGVIGYLFERDDFSPVIVLSPTSRLPRLMTFLDLVVVCVRDRIKTFLLSSCCMHGMYVMSSLSCAIGLFLCRLGTIIVCKLEVPITPYHSKDFLFLHIVRSCFVSQHNVVYSNRSPILIR